MAGSVVGPSQKPQFSAQPEVSIPTYPKALAKRVAHLLNVSIENVHIVGVGKDKIVAKVIGENGVFQVPQKSFLGQCRKNIQKEVDFAQTIVAANVDTTNLAVDVKEAKPRRGWQMSEAEGNLEKKIRASHSWDACKSYVKGFVSGIKNLHAAGCIHGDVKLENILLFLKNIVKLADFGKGTKVSGDAPAGIYSGNTRYGPPEGVKSKSGDVYGAGIALIRMVEEQFLNGKTSLIPVHETIRKIPPADKERRGIEKYILDSPEFSRSYEQKGTILGKIKDFQARLRTQSGIDNKTLGFEVDAMNRYIKVLGSQLDSKIAPEKARTLELLLRAMTAIDPQNRPSMELVEHVLNFVMGDKPASELPPHFQLLITTEAPVQALKGALEAIFGANK